MPIDVSGFIPDNTPNKGLDLMAQKLDDNAKRRYEINYLKQKDKEADDWKKMQLINDLTDMSKHQTGSDVANAIGAQKVADIYQKYTQNASKMSFPELQAGIQKEMFGTIQAMDAAKEELSQADEQIKLLKTKFPSIDIGRLSSDYRKEIVSRRINPDGTFTNPLQVGLSNFDVTDPEHLSDYVVGNKELSNAIINPQGAETVKVFSGNPRAYTEYTAKVPFWKKENFDRTTLKDGFLNIKGEPKLDLKASAIPAISPNQKGQSFMVIDDDVYRRFAEDDNLKAQITTAAKEKFGDAYKNFTPEEKELAKRNVLYDKMKTLDQTDYYPSGVKAEPITRNHTTINMPGENAKNDLYERIKSAAKKSEDDKDPYTQFNLLPLDAQTQIVADVNATRPEDGKLTQKDLVLKYDPSKDNVDVFKVDASDGRNTSKWEYIGPLSQVGTNLKVQPNSKAKVAVVADANKGVDKGNPPEYSHFSTGSYGGKKIKIGYKNGGWYNIETGKKIN